MCTIWLSLFFAKSVSIKELSFIETIFCANLVDYGVNLSEMFLLLSNIMNVVLVINVSMNLHLICKLSDKIQSLEDCTKLKDSDDCIEQKDSDDIIIMQNDSDDGIEEDSEDIIMINDSDDCIEQKDNDNTEHIVGS